MTTGAITRVIDRLERAGYVRRERDLHDRRSVLIQLQPKMAEIDALIKRYLKQAWSDLYLSYSQQEIAVILDFLRKAHPLNREALSRLQRDGDTTISS